MKCMLVHNYYQHHGGEDEVFRAEQELLASRGHDVAVYTRSNDEISDYRTLRKMGLGFRATWATDTARQFRSILKQTKPDIVHFHNIFPLISPAAYYVCRNLRLPVVQTIHNYRLICPAATCFRDHDVCEECSKQGLWRSVVHGCYRESRSATASVAAMLITHRLLNTWKEKVDRFIALTQFSKEKLIENGLPRHKIAVRPNFLSADPGKRSSEGQGAVFVGRLTDEKGLRTLLEAWKRLRSRLPLRIVGDGHIRPDLERIVRGGDLSEIRFEGHLSHEQTIKAIKEARFLVFPSEWFECFPLTLVEAFACGVPVIASRIGAVSEIVEDGRTGLLFEAGNPAHLAGRVEWAFANAGEMRRMGDAARLEFESKYVAEINYDMLMQIYHSAFEQGRVAHPSLPRISAQPGAGTAHMEL
jgi:glycosyltransferase involved in cell wall biosynthesis